MYLTIHKTTYRVKNNVNDETGIRSTSCAMGKQISVPHVGERIKILYE